VTMASTWDHAEAQRADFLARHEAVAAETHAEITREAIRVAGKPHGDPDHSCSWACPGADPMADIRAVVADIGAGMTGAELYAKHYRAGPFSFGPEVSDEFRAQVAAMMDRNDDLMRRLADS